MLQHRRIALNFEWHPLEPLSDQLLRETDTSPICVADTDSRKRNDVAGCPSIRAMRSGNESSLVWGRGGGDDVELSRVAVASVNSELCVNNVSFTFPRVVGPELWRTR